MGLIGALTISWRRSADRAAVAQKAPAVVIRNGVQHVRAGNLLLPISASNSKLGTFLKASIGSSHLPDSLLVQLPLAMRFKKENAEWSMGRRPLQQGDALTAKVKTKRADVTAIFMPEPPAAQVGLLVSPHLMSETDLIQAINASADETRTRHPDFQLIHGKVTNAEGQKAGRYLQLPDARGRPVLSITAGRNSQNLQVLTSQNDIFVEDFLARLNGQRPAAAWRR